MDILFFLLLGHIAGDYAFQSDSMATSKSTSLKSLTLHVLVYVVTIWAFFLFYSLLYLPGHFLQSATLIFLAALFVQHWFQDYWKSRFGNNSKQVYYLDQFVHLLILYLYRIFIF